MDDRYLKNYMESPALYSWSLFQPFAISQTFTCCECLHSYFLPVPSTGNGVLRDWVLEGIRFCQWHLCKDLTQIFLPIKAASIQFSCQKHSLSWLCIYCYESLFQNPEGNLSVRDNFAIWSHVDLIGWLSLMEWFIHHSRCCEWYHLPLDWRDNWHGWVSIENLSEAWTWSARCLMIESESEWPTILRSQEMAHATTIQSVLLRAFKAFTRQKS